MQTNYEDKDPQDWTEEDMQEFLEDEGEMYEELLSVLESTQAAEGN